ncbi:MAG TPA: aldolase/citrate lyase family protein, partial [Pseudonocardiaceae bacterium]
MTAPADPQGARSAGNHRSWLFVPGNRPDRFDKALASGADAVIVDLEDAVAPPDKTHARDEVARLLAGHDAFVRINGADTEWYADDLAALGRRPGLAGIILPKATTAADVADVAARTAPGVAIVALVETAAGLHNAGAIAASSHTTRLAFGSIDFALDI